MALPNQPPKIITTPIAEVGNRKEIVTASDPANLCYPLGFGEAFQTPISKDGTPIPAASVNEFMNLFSSFMQFYQYGNQMGWNDIIGNTDGYPLGAVLRYYPDPNNPQFSVQVTSMKENNKDNFQENPAFIGTSWMLSNAGISESGETENGTYFKFSNGLLIQWSKPSGVISVGQDVVPYVFNFPIPFVNKNYLAFSTFTAETWNRIIFTWFTHTSKTVNSISLSLYYHLAGATATLNQVMILTIGFWRSL